MQEVGKNPTGVMENLKKQVEQSPLAVMVAGTFGGVVMLTLQKTQEALTGPEYSYEVGNSTYEGLKLSTERFVRAEGREQNLVIEGFNVAKSQHPNCKDATINLSLEGDNFNWSSTAWKCAEGDSTCSMNFIPSKIEGLQPTVSMTLDCND